VLYKDSSQPIDARVADLLARMTLEEKVAQLGAWMPYYVLGPHGPDPDKLRALLGQGIGQISRIGGILDVPPERVAELYNAIQRFLVEDTRLGIPAVVHEECLNGYSGRGGTVFPQIIGVAATWDPERVEQMAGVIRTQMRAVGAHQGLAPVLDVARDPRWGRTEEVYGEDPYLISRMGSAYVRGLQGAQSADSTNGVVATAKHFLGYGVSEGGMNWAPAHIPARELYEVFARPFEAAIREAGLASLMNAYHELDGVPCGMSREIMTDLLRGKLGFDGYTVSDYVAIRTAWSYHHVAEDLQGAAIQALRAGLDVDLPNSDGYAAPLIEAVRAGRVSEAQVDVSVRRVLAAKFRLGLFERPYVDPQQAAQVFAQTEGRELAHQIAVEGMTLLKNDGGVLPLGANLKRIAVIGPNADSVRNLMGDYTFAGQMAALVETIKTGAFSAAGSAKVDEDTRLAVLALFERYLNTDEETFTRAAYDGAPSILDAIRATVPAGTQVRYARGCDVHSTSRTGFDEAVETARQSQLAVLVLGEKSGLDASATCGESRDRADLDLPGVQQQLLEAVAATGTPVVLVLVGGRPLAITWAAQAASVPAILAAWVPGQAGGAAVADVLFGRASPGGKLPISVPRSVGQVPVYYNHKPSGGRTFWAGDYVDLETTPLYPFGHGLSYATFAYGNLRISPSQVDSYASVTIACDIANTGTCEAAEVVQLYLHDREAAVTRPVQELMGFRRVMLAPGQARTVEFVVPMNLLGFCGRDMAFVVEPGHVDVLVGSSSADIRLRGEFEIVGEQVDVLGRRAFFSAARDYAPD
jgi:beta-glucosidase